MPCELLLPLAHPLGRAVRKIFWDKGDLGDVRVPAHQHAEEVYQKGEHLHLREWSPDGAADYEERLRYIRVFVGGEGVEGAEEEEGEEAEEEELKTPVDIEPELSTEVDVDAPPQLPAPRPKPSPKGAGAFPPPKPAPKHAPAMDAPPKPPAKGAVRRKPQPAYKYGGKNEL